MPVPLTGGGERLAGLQDSTSMVLCPPHIEHVLAVLSVRPEGP